MKKVILFGAAAVFALSMASCSKDHTCTCAYTAGGPADVFVYPKSSKKSAEDACKKQQTYLTATYQEEVTCSI